MKIKNVIKAGNDVIDPKWIIDSVAAQYVLPLTPRYYIHMTPATEERVKDLSSDEENGPAVSRNRKSPAKSSKTERSSSPEVPPIKKGKTETSAKNKYGDPRETQQIDSETEEEASTASDSDHPSGPSGKVRMVFSGYFAQ
jgi:hypothetical protein